MNKPVDIVPVAPLPAVMLEPLVRAALLEDLGRAGDITTDAIVPADAQARTRLVARQEGVLAGLDLARLAFRLMDAGIIAMERRSIRVLDTPALTGFIQ